MPTKTIEAGPFHRSLEIRAADINDEARTVEVAFSSEAPVDRWFGTEILDHDVGSVRLDRLKNGGALLMDHNIRDQIGVVESVSIDGDRKGRAVVRFSEHSERAKQIFAEVQDGIRRHISVGYRIHHMTMQESGDDGEIYRADDWEPYEISLVSVPADPTVGVGRASNGESNTISIETREEPTMLEHDDKREKQSQPAQPVIPAYSIDGESARVEAIRKLGDLYDADPEFVRDFITSDKGPDQFRAAMREAMPKAPENPQKDASIGMTEQETRKYSFIRAIHFLANPTDRRAREAAAFEIECSQAAAERMGKTSQGLMVPHDVVKRDLSVGTDTAGGHTVATDLLTGSFIDLLRNRMVVSALGATYLTDLVGNIAIPRQTSGATAYWVAEAGAPTESQQAFDQVTLSPKTVGAYTDYSRKLMLQGSIDVESFVRGDLARVLGLAIDLAALYGSGASNQPTGVVNTTGINNGTTFAAADPTFAEVVSLESEVAADNADVGTLAYVTDAAMRGAFKTTEKASGTAQFIWEPGNTVNGYRCEITNQMTDGDVIFGNWADLLVGMWGGLDLMVDPYTHSTSGTVRIVALQDVDIAVRHPESFALGNDTP